MDVSVHIHDGTTDRAVEHICEMMRMADGNGGARVDRCDPLFNLLGTVVQERGNGSRKEGGGRSSWPDAAHGVIIWLVSLLLSLPVFLLVYPHLPRWVLPVGHGWRVDHLLALVLIMAAFIVLVRRFQLAVYIMLVAGLGTITVTSLTGRYGFRDLFQDYTVLLSSMRGNTEPLPMLLQEEGPFPGAAEISAHIDYRDPVVRSFAVRAATTWFTDLDVPEEDAVLVQCFSVFKVINSNWRYVNDAQGVEYFARASESTALLAGDCDDHAILMAACIKAIGGNVRLVRTTGHIYPELRVGNAADMERAATLIRERLFPRSARHATLFYHIDPKGDRWINLDYTRDYPGGEVMDEAIRGVMGV